MHEAQLQSQISSLKSRHYAIIVAGGSGTRMKSAVPKQFLLLKGLPVLMHTLQAFHQSQPQPNIILVLSEDYHTYWMHLCADHQFQLPHQLVSGGNSRYQSVKNALDLIEDDALVAVHDAVRPLIDVATIEETYHQAAIQGAVVVAVKSRDSVRQLKDNRTQSLLRNEIYLVQTPQTFQAALLKQAYRHPYCDGFTDDASVVEKAGHQVYIVEGSYQNFKITFPQDIAIAELLLK